MGGVDGRFCELDKSEYTGPTLRVRNRGRRPGPHIKKVKLMVVEGPNRL